MFDLTKAKRLGWFVASLAILCSLSTHTRADDCDAAAGELAARIPGVKIGRRTSVVIFLEHPAIKVASIGCPIGNRKPNLVISAEGKFPGFNFFDFIGDAGHIVVGVSNDKIREGAVRCHKAALKSGGEDVEISFAGLLFVCSADKLTTAIDVEVPAQHPNTKRFQSTLTNRLP
jgi:hypothetical protein